MQICLGVTQRDANFSKAGGANCALRRKDLLPNRVSVDVFRCLGKTGVYSWSLLASPVLVIDWLHCKFLMDAFITLDAKSRPDKADITTVFIPMFSNPKLWPDACTNN